MRAGRITKAVIAREIAVTASRPFDRHGILHRLKAAFGSSYRFAVDGLLRRVARAARRRRRAVPSRRTRWPARRRGPATPTATPRSPPRSIESTKNQVEHRVVIDMVHDTLLPWCSYLDWEPEPSIVTVANVQHLGTRIEGRLSSPPPHVATLVRALSPTPALGGHPGAEALKLIADVEGVDRDRYGGAVGWLDASRQRHVGGGDPLRPAVRRPASIARLHAGGGIVADSDPLAELAETQAKFQAMLSAHHPPLMASGDGGVERRRGRRRSRRGRWRLA